VSSAELTGEGDTPENLDCRTDCTTQGSETGCAQRCADPDLRAVVAAWPTLPEHVRLAILALADTGSKR
jgi:hypothetical protein